MTSTPPTRALLLPGTGSDEEFVTASCAGPLAQAGLAVEAIAPTPGKDLVSAAFAELDARSGDTPVVVGGISLGAHLAALWALRAPSRCAGLIAVMPGWCGSPSQAPAAVSARMAAASVRSLGMREALTRAVAGVPAWLSAELQRAWPRHGEQLAPTLDTAANSVAPTLEELARLSVPAAVIGCVGDPVHPVDVAQRWATALPTASYREFALTDFEGPHGLESLGRTTATAWHAAISPPDSITVDKLIR